MASLHIPRLVSGGLITNYFCSSRCRHCLYFSSPERETEYVAPEAAEEAFRLARKLGCGAMHIGGGEPMLRPEHLAAVLGAARRAGMPLEYVETNSAWAVDGDSAHDRLTRLRTKGLTTLLVSISPFHNEHIPYARVMTVMDAARRAGVGLFPWINGFVRDLTAFDVVRVHSLDEFARRFGEDYLRRIPGRYWIHMGGRALETFRPVMGAADVETILRSHSGHCLAELSDTRHFHIDLFGGYVPGLCSGLAVALEDLGRPLSPGKYPVLTALAEHGVAGLFDLAVSEFDFTAAPSGYLGKCDLCTDIRAYLIRRADASFPELAPKGFYEERRRCRGEDGGGARGSL